MREKLEETGGDPPLPRQLQQEPWKYGNYNK